eukprot:1827314-Pleurochrysis_carterae.AAC.1
MATRMKQLDHQCARFCRSSSWAQGGAVARVAQRDFLFRKSPKADCLSVQSLKVGALNTQADSVRA